jgi:mRNA interferase RelE/StbE
MTELFYSDQAREHLENLETEPAQRLVAKFEEAADWTDHRLNSLSNSAYYSLRAGDYRAIINWDRDADALTMVAAGHRRNIYDRYL